MARIVEWPRLEGRAAVCTHDRGGACMYSLCAHATNYELKWWRVERESLCPVGRKMGRYRLYGLWGWKRVSESGEPIVTWIRLRVARKVRLGYRNWPKGK